MHEFTDDDVSRLNIDSDILNSSENYTYITYLNSLEMIPTSDVNAK